MIDLCTGEGQLPRFERDVVIDSKNSGVILDGGSKADKEDCTAGPAALGLWAKGFNNGFDFKLNGGKNFEIRNIDGTGILICGGDCDGEEESLGTIEITGVIIDNVVDQGIEVVGSNLESLAITNSEISSNDGEGIAVSVEACADEGLSC